MNKERLKKLKQRKEKIAEDSADNIFLFIKADQTIRVRPLPVEENAEFGMEVIQFYLGPDIKGVISPHTFGEECAIYNKWKKLKDSSDDGDKELAGKLKPKRKYLIPVVKMTDTKSSTPDERTGVRLLQVAQGVYQQMIDYALDSEHGDFTDPEKGYDFKITRTGKTQFDTEYSLIVCKSTPLAKKFRKVYSIEEILRKDMPTYDETKSKLKQFMGSDEEPKKKSSDGGVVKKKKKKTDL
jgi:hypothetical protein